MIFLNFYWIYVPEAESQLSEKKIISIKKI